MRPVITSPRYPSCDDSEFTRRGVGYELHRVRIRSLLDPVLPCTGLGEKGLKLRLYCVHIGAMPQKEYSKSDLRIHEYLTIHVEGIARRLQKAMQNGLKINPAAMFWPRHPVIGDDGRRIEGVVAMDLPPGDPHKHLVAGVERTAAYAILLITPLEDGGAKLVMESPVGTETWVLRKQRRGDTFLVLDPVRTTGRDKLGVVWEQD